MKVLETGEPAEFRVVDAASGSGLLLDISAFKAGETMGLVTRDVSERERYQGRLEALHSHAAGLSTLDSKEEVAHSTMEIIRDLLGFSIGSFGFIKDGRIVFTEFREESSIHELDLNGQGITVRAVNSGETQLVMDTRKEPDYIVGRTDGETLSELDVPIKIGESVVALINLESNQVGGFQEEDQVLVETLGLHVGSALDRLNRENVLNETLDELAVSELRSRLFRESANDGFIMFDADMRLIEANDSWLQMTGFKREDVIGKHALEIYPALKETGRYDAYLKVLETGESIEYRAIMSVIGRDLILDASVFKAGDVLGLVTRDVTEQVKYQRRLEMLNEHASLLATQNTVQEVVVVTFQIIEDLFGYNYGSFGLVEGESIHHILIPKVETVNDFYQPINGVGVCPRAVRSGVTQVVNETRDDPDFSIAVAEGIYEPRSELVAPILVEGKVGAILNVESLSPNAFSVDEVRLVELLANHVSSALNRIIETEKRLESEKELMAERVQRENEQELGRLKTRFMSTATHELRTPLASIQGYTELVRDDEDNLSDAQKQYFTVIQRNVRRLVTLTDDLLDVQRLEEGRTLLNLTQVNVLELLADVENEFTPMLIDKKQSIRVNCVDVVVSVDRLRVMQVLVNLLSNASKFSPDGSEIVIDVVETGDGVRFSVSDNGFGLKEEDIGKLFTPFPSIDRLVVTEKSTGLGLSICKGIVELHGGTIWAESDGIGKGSKFSFTLPKAARGKNK